MKYCPRCKQTKDFLDFHKNKSRADGLQAECKSCTIERACARKRPERKIQDRIRHKNNKLKDYGVTETIQELEESQSHKCAICGKLADLHIDHCHLTNKYRGLLCMQCNTGLGKFYDNVEYLQQAIKYLSEQG